MGCRPDDGRLSRTPPHLSPCSSHSRGLFNNRKETALLLALQEGRVECKTPGGRGGSPRRGRKNARGSESLFGSGLTHSSRTYRAVADALEEAVMRKVRERLEMLSPHHVLALLSPIEQSEARELGEMVWSALFCEPGALDDAFCEDEMVDGCVVCLSRQKDAVILPYRHLVVCADQIEHCCPYSPGKADEALVVEYPEWPDV
ncbi:hypothetical protein GMRT_24022 [Giardia muris]|uniref:Uncharacterized protein n=1 Tax=Giardia muris TaxID=5742 RepID=A0A4Z1T384_GIAMU|nr:hypothetical protein GMRT_24022 [Giardia muris]|eukprot:TNJ27019.1 hypothetical protein GMRT_24022 [Giardia muris]